MLGEKIHTKRGKIHKKQNTTWLWLWLYEWPEAIKFTGADNQMMVASVRVRGNNEKLYSWYRVSVLCEENFLEICHLII